MECMEKANLFIFSSNMKKFFLKAIVLFIIGIVVVFLHIIRVHPDILKDKSFKHIPLNNVSNSESYRAKLDHMLFSDNFSNASFLIVGSSMAVNNISGEVISNITNECVYNTSSWGLRSNQINELVKIFKTKKTKYILYAFNNVDFGRNGNNIDYELTSDLLYGNNFLRVYDFVDNFNITTFYSDWENRIKSKKNTYSTLNFDEFGSLEIISKGFVIDKNRWDKSYGISDFNFFVKDLDTLSEYCQVNDIKLFLVYLPYRPNLLNENQVLENNKVSYVLESRYGETFIDLHNLTISTAQFCDGTHMFKEGARNITKTIMDSIFYIK